MGCLIFTCINLSSFPMCGSGRLSPAPPLCASGKPPGALPPWGRSSRGTSLEELSFHPLLHSCTGFFPAHYHPCFLLDRQQHIILTRPPPTPPSAARVVPTTVPVPVTTKPPIVGCPCVAAAQGSQSPQPPCPHGAQAPRRRARAALCFCPRGNRVVHNEYLDPSIHPSASSFFFFFPGRTPWLVGF